MSTTGQLSMVIPAYNEGLRIPSTIARILEYFKSQDYAFEIIVVDDGSKDNTSSVITQISKEDNRVKLVSQPHNMGKGAAIRRGFEEATGDIICFSDADLSTPIEELPKLLEALVDHEVAIGIRSFSREGQTRFRKIGAIAINRFVRLIALPDIIDSQCGFKAFRLSAAKQLTEGLTITGFSFDIQLLYKAQKKGFSIAQIPVEWHNTTESKVSPVKDGFRLLRETLKIRIQNA